MSKITDLSKTNFAYQSFIRVLTQQNMERLLAEYMMVPMTNHRSRAAGGRAAFEARDDDRGFPRRDFERDFERS